MIETVRHIGRFKLHPLLPWLGAALCTLHFRFEPRLAVCAGAVLFLVLRYWRRRALECPRTPSDHVLGRMVGLSLSLVFAVTFVTDTVNFFLPERTSTPLPELLAAPPAAGAGEFDSLALITGILIVVLAFIFITAFSLLVASLPRFSNEVCGVRL